MIKSVTSTISRLSFNLMLYQSGCIIYPWEKPQSISYILLLIEVDERIHNKKNLWYHFTISNPWKLQKFSFYKFSQAECRSKNIFGWMNTDLIWNSAITSPLSAIRKESERILLKHLIFFMELTCFLLNHRSSSFFSQLYIKNII